MNSINSVSEIRLVVFDCDGTLVDSQHHIVGTMADAFTALDLEPPSAAHVRSIIGLSLPIAIAQLAPTQPPTALQAIEAAYKAAFLERRQRPDHDEPLYPGTLACLKSLRDDGYLLGIATGKSLRGLKATLERHDLLQWFVTLQTADTAPSKPHPAMLIQAMAEAGADPMNTVLVGDTSFDMEMALSAKVAGIGVTWGYHSPAILQATGARAVIDDFEKLPHMISQFIGGAECVLA